MTEPLTPLIRTSLTDAVREGGWPVLVVLAAALIAVSYHNYLLFHTLAEAFAIVTAVLMFVVAWQTYPFSRNNFLMYLACGYIWIGMLDLAHTLTYKGMNILPADGANTATQFWIATRYLEALLLVSAPLFLDRGVRRHFAFIAFALVASAIYLLVMNGIFPDAFIEGRGLTPFKVNSEYVIIAIMAGALVFLLMRRDKVERPVIGPLAASIILTMGGEMAFTYYVSVYGLSNLVGHIFKLVSFWLIFVAIVRSTLVRPYLEMERRVERRTTSLRETGRLLETVFDTTHLMLAYLDPRFTFIRVNRAYAAADGRTPDHFPGKNHFDLYPSEENLEIFEAVVRTGEPYFTTAKAFEYADAPDRGKSFWDWSLLPVKDAEGGVTGLILALIDVTERVRFESQLRQSESMARALLDASFDATMLVNEDGTLLSANEATANRLAKPLSELIGTRIYDHFPPALAEARRRQAEQVLATGQALHTYDERAGRYLQNHIYPIVDATGKAHQLAIFSHDVTEEKTLQRNLERSNTDLEQFAYSVSHDLQEPLRMVSTYVQMLERKYADTLPDDAKEVIGFALDGSSRMRRLIKDLLEYSRINTEGTDPTATDLGGVAEEALKNLEMAIKDAKADVKIHDLPAVLGDRSQLVRLFQNLIGNAVKYRSPERPLRVEISATRGGDTWTVSVRDTGLGIAPEFQEKVFGIFQRLQSDREGTGIGLALCRKIVERHGGRLWLKSDTGAGSTFLFTLDAAD